MSPASLGSYKFSCVENYLRCMVHLRPTNWSSWLPVAKWWYNFSYQSAIQITPFEALFGYAPPLFHENFTLDSSVGAVGRLLQER